MKASRLILGAMVLVVVGLTGLASYLIRSRSSDTVFEPPARRVEPGTPAAWRNMDHDLTNWFPAGANIAAHDLILSGKRLELQAKLGRPLRPEEMALHYYAIRAKGEVLGYVLPHRMKGTHGAIEFVLTLDPDHRIHRFEIQSIREPAETIRALQALNLGREFARHHFALPEAAGQCAREIAEEVQTLLTLWHTGETRVHH